MTLIRSWVRIILLLSVCAPLLAPSAPTQAQDQSVSVAAAAGPAQLEGDLPGDPQVHLIQVAEGFFKPANLAFPPDGSGRIFVVEVGGLIRIVNPDGSIAPRPFLDLSSTVSLRPGQQGLLGLAFHPDFATNGRLFVDYNNLYANGAITISEFQVSADDPNRADPRTERPLLVIDKPYPQHNGGTLRFGPDGYLYISTGDGGWQGDPYDNAQNRFSLLGKILRIDVDGSAPGQPYGIPVDNPFAGLGRYDNPYPGAAPEVRGERRQRAKDTAGTVAPDDRKNIPPVRKEIWALGFRNPWQFSFDPSTGDAYIADVGADTWEEINFQPAETTAGQNYGWDWLEASHCYPPQLTDCSRQQVGVLPVAEYEHGLDGCAVIGLGVSRDEAYPSLDGIYFSADYCTGEIRGLQRDENGVWQFQSVLDMALLITGAGQDAAGAIYITAESGEDVPEGADAGDGTVWKLVAADAVPAGAVTAPLGQPRQGEIAIDEEGEIAPDDEGMAAENATPAADRPAATPVQPPLAETDAAQEAVIGLYDMYFEPDRVILPANTDVRIVLENRGAAPHNFEVRNQDIDVDVPPGGTAEVIVNLPAGDYKFICNVPGHKQIGMNGVLVVKG